MPSTKALIFSVSFADRYVDLHVEFELDGEAVTRARLWHDETSGAGDPHRYTTFSGGSPREDGWYATSVQASGSLGLRPAPYTVHVAIDDHIAGAFERSFSLDPDQRAASAEHVIDPLIEVLKNLVEDAHRLREIPDGSRLHAVASWHDVPSPDAPRWTIQGIHLYVVA